MKPCVKCLKNKRPGLFEKDKRRKDGRGSYCLVCKNKYGRLQNITKKTERNESRKKWLKNNKEKRLDYIRIYNRERAKIDIEFKLKRNLRARTWSALKGKSKVSSAIKELGISSIKFKKYLESNFQQGMTWENYGNKEGKWSLDHIKPLSKFNLENLEEYKKASHYSNIQPMWHIENLKKNDK